MLNEDQIAERSAQMARRDDREYRQYLSGRNEIEVRVLSRVLGRPLAASALSDAFPTT
jgi:hypothetical protein